MPRDPTVDRVLAYYAALLVDAGIIEKFRELAGVTLAESGLPIEISRESPEVLALLLHARGIKLCFYCHEVRPYQKFRSVGGRACSTCLDPKNRGYQRRWRQENRERRRLYMKEYRSKSDSSQ